MPVVAGHPAGAASRRNHARDLELTSAQCHCGSRTCATWASSRTRFRVISRGAATLSSGFGNIKNRFIPPNNLLSPHGCLDIFVILRRLFVFANKVSSIAEHPYYSRCCGVAVEYLAMMPKCAVSSGFPEIAEGHP